MSGHMIILTRRQFNGIVLFMVAAIAVMAVCSVIVIEGTYDRGRQAGYQAGYADAARVACTTPGEVSGLCWSLSPQLPECEHEDGAPEGCLRRDSDGSTYWEMSD